MSFQPVRASMNLAVSIFNVWLTLFRANWCKQESGVLLLTMIAVEREMSSSEIPSDILKLRTLCIFVWL